jgi:hypothetical protein
MYEKHTAEYDSFVSRISLALQATLARHRLMAGRVRADDGCM